MSAALLGLKVGRVHRRGPTDDARTALRLWLLYCLASGFLVGLALG